MNDDDIFEITRKDRGKLLKLQSLIHRTKKMPPWENQRKEELEAFISEIECLVRETIESLNETNTPSDIPAPKFVSDSSKPIKNVLKPQVGSNFKENEEYRSAQNLKRDSFEEGRKFAEREYSKKLKILIKEEQEKLLSERIKHNDELHEIENSYREEIKKLKKQLSTCKAKLKD